MKAARWVASFDSATAMLRALGRFLHGKDFPALGVFPGFALESAGDLLARLPASVLETIYTYAGGLEAISPEELGRVRAEEISRYVTSFYPENRVPAVAIGSSNGALTHLWAALGIPWLPQTVLIPFRQRGVDPDEGSEDLVHALAHGSDLLDANPELSLHHMHDPNQDRLMIRRMTYFRVKRLVLGAIFERFLEERLEPGGTIFVSECELTWPSVRVSDRYFFQLGAPGGATKDEYVHGGPRIAAFLAREGSRRRRFDFPEPDGESREAEWGFEPALLEDVRRFARERGYRVRRVVHENPDDASPFVADLYRWWYRARGYAPSRLLIESFILMEPWLTLRTGSVPFWTMFAVEPSMEAVERYLSRVEPFEQIYALAFQHGVESVGVASIEDLYRLLAHATREGHLLGLDESLHPRDFGTFLRYHAAIERIAARYPMPGPLALDDLDRFIASRPPDAGVRFVDDVTSEKRRAA